MNFRFETTEFFNKQLKKLTRRYPNIKADLKRFIQDFKEGRGRGRAIPGLRHKVYKARMKSTDMRRGKRGGFRIIYYLQIADGKIIFLSIYAKSRREDIRVQEILEFLDRAGIEL